jgi:hypothetical protein
MVAYNPNIPSTGGVPAVQYTSIQSNFASIQSLIDVNHVDFASGNYGQHTLVQFPAAISPSAPTGTASVFYPGNIAGATSPYATNIAPLYQNAQGTTIGGMNAFVNLTANGSANTTSITSQFNVASVGLSSHNNFLVTFTNSLPSDKYCYFVTVFDPNATPYGIQGLSVATGSFSFRVLGVGSVFSFSGLHIVVLGA